MKNNLKRSMIMSAASVLIFVGAGFIYYFFYLPANFKVEGNDLLVTNLNFTEKIYPQLLELEKNFSNNFN